MTINKDAWNKLSPEEQKALEQAAAETETWLVGKVKDVVEKDMANHQGEEADFEFPEITPEFRAELEKLAAKVR